MYQGLPDRDAILTIRLQNMIRFSILEFIPELSVIVAASQGARKCLVARIYFNVAQNKYELKPLATFPNSLDDHVPLSGMTILKISDKDSPIAQYAVLLLYQDAQVTSFVLTQKVSS
mmetsp:Transcript_22558/g.25125  ORF Transcript_22558/g.25125 Transcript_22558/m.25125 type:complete len:117 (-) Transcript_22558:19-369(-)